MEALNDVALRVPSTLLDEVQHLAKREAMSVEDFLIRAAEERVATLRARAYLAERAARAKPGALARALARPGGEPPVPGDELPAGWLGPGPNGGAR